MADDDNWGITPDFKNVMTEKQQRYGVDAVPGRVDHIDPSELLQDVIKSDSESKKDAVANAAYGYGGKFGVEKDRMDKSAVGNDYQTKLHKHPSQEDYAKGFGGRYGVQKDRQDKNAVGYDYHEKLSRHASQTDYSKGFGGKFGVQKDRVDSSSFDASDNSEPLAPHPSQRPVEVTVTTGRARELRERFEKLALEQNKPAERPERPPVGRLKFNAAAQSTTNKSTASGPSSPRYAPPASAKKKTSPLTAVALFNYDAAQDDELSFKVGDTIVDIDKFEKEWWFGYVGNRSGIFPCNHVEEIKYGTVMPTPDKEDQTKPPEPPKIITATALYDFVASQEDELPFKAGDRIFEIDKFDSDWWSGRIGDRHGIFPANHVSED